MDDKPHYTRIFLGCWKCSEQELPLQRCGGCKRVCYCSSKCQKDDWAAHKTFCKALAAIENPSDSKVLLIGLYDQRQYFNNETEQLNFHTKTQGATKALLVKMKAKRPLSDAEHNLIAFEPRCLACTRTAQDIRMEEIVSPGTQSTRTIRACKDCGYSFYCSDEHFGSARRMHSEVPYEDGHDGRSQCEMNQEISMDLRYEDCVFKDHPEFKFMFQAGEVKSVWESLEGRTWHEEYMSSLAKTSEDEENELTETMLRHDSDILTLSMTILFALEKLNLGDDAWTRKEVLTIHFIGANLQEMKRELSLDELFHYLPDLKEIKFLLCGPDFRYLSPESHETKEWVVKNCVPCAARGNKFIQSFYAGTYHAYVNNQGTSFTKPDVAVAFNSGCGAGLETQSAAYRMLDIMADTSSWRETEKLLIEKKIPTLFTANNSEEAIVDEQRLISAGATFVPGLERQRNPWGSMLSHTRPSMLRGFQSYNRWIVGGFR